MRSPQSAIRNPQSHAGGFTLVELIITILISGIVLAVGVVRLGRSAVLIAEGERVARRLVADLRYTQSEAVANSKEHRLSFVRKVQGKFVAYGIYRKEEGYVQIEPIRDIHEDVALTGDSADVEFYPGGDAKKNYTYTLTSPGHTYRITVTLATGAVRLEEL